MKWSQSQTQSPTPHKRETRTLSISFIVSALLHALLAGGIMGLTWLGGKPSIDRLSAYTVALVDAPLSIQKQPPAVSKSAPPSKQEAKQEAKQKAKPKSEPTRPPPPATKKKTDDAPRPPKQASQSKPKVVPKPKKPPAKTVATKPKAIPDRKKPPTPSKPAVATSKEVKSAIERLRQQQAQQELTQQKAEKAQERAASERIMALRQQVSKEAEVNSTAGLQRVRFAVYQERVRSQIIEAWILPLPREQAQSLEATVLFRVTRDGHVDGLDLLESSGHPLFDASLVRAIKRASPLPGLPADYPQDMLEVEMRFRAREPAAG